MYINSTDLPPTFIFSPSWQKCLWRNTCLSTTHAMTLWGIPICIQVKSQHGNGTNPNEHPWGTWQQTLLVLLYYVGSVRHYRSCPPLKHAAWPLRNQGYCTLVVKVLSVRPNAIRVHPWCHFHPQPLKLGVPQGSVLGPVHLSLYSPPVADVVRAHDVAFQIYLLTTRNCI